MNLVPRSAANQHCNLDRYSFFLALSLRPLGRKSALVSAIGGVLLTRCAGANPHCELDLRVAFYPLLLQWTLLLPCIIHASKHTCTHARGALHMHACMHECMHAFRYARLLALQGMAWHSCTAWHCMAWHGMAVYCNALQCIAWHCIALPHPPLRR